MENVSPPPTASRLRHRTPGEWEGSPATYSSDVYKLVRQMNAGFVPLRRGLLEHFQTGKLSKELDIVVLMTIFLQCDHSKGLWWGSADRIVGALPFARKVRVKRSLARLEELKYIRRFDNPCGRGNYPVLVNKYLLPDGSFIDAWASESWQKPARYREDFDENRSKTDEIESEIEQKQVKSAPKPTPYQEEKRKEEQESNNRHLKPERLNSLTPKIASIRFAHITGCLVSGDKKTQETLLGLCEQYGDDLLRRMEDWHRMVGHDEIQRNKKWAFKNFCEQVDKIPDSIQEEEAEPEQISNRDRFDTWPPSKKS